MIFVVNHTFASADLQLKVYPGPFPITMDSTPDRSLLQKETPLTTSSKLALEIHGLLPRDDSKEGT